MQRQAAAADLFGRKVRQKLNEVSAVTGGDCGAFWQQLMLYAEREPITQGCSELLLVHAKGELRQAAACLCARAAKSCSARVRLLHRHRLEASRLGLIVGALSRDVLVSLAPLRRFTLEAAPLLEMFR